MINLVLSITISLFFAHTVAYHHTAAYRRARASTTAERCVGERKGMADWAQRSANPGCNYTNFAGVGSTNFKRAARKRALYIVIVAALVFIVLLLFTDLIIKKQ